MRKDAEPGQAFPNLEMGDYGKDNNGEWWARVPEKGFPTARISKHTVTEHADGTITASPSILMSIGDGRQWHGWLEKGIWRKC